MKPARKEGVSSANKHRRIFGEWKRSIFDEPIQEIKSKVVPRRIRSISINIRNDKQCLGLQNPERRAFKIRERPAATDLTIPDEVFNRSLAARTPLKSKSDASVAKKSATSSDDFSDLSLRFMRARANAGDPETENKQELQDEAQRFQDISTQTSLQEAKGPPSVDDENDKATNPPTRKKAGANNSKESIQNEDDVNESDINLNNEEMSFDDSSTGESLSNENELLLKILKKCSSKSTYEISPEDAFKDIKGDRWNSEILMVLSPFDSDTIHDAQIVQLHIIDKIYKEYLDYISIPKTQVKALISSGIPKRYSVLFTSKEMIVEKEMSALIETSRSIGVLEGFCSVVPSVESHPPLWEVFNALQTELVNAKELAFLFNLAERHQLSIYVHPNYHAKEDLYFLEFFSKDRNYISTISAKYETILAQVAKNRSIAHNIHVIMDVHELVTNRSIRRFLLVMASYSGLFYFYNLLGRFLYGIYKLLP